MSDHVRSVDPFYRTRTERVDHESWWRGYADGLDGTGARQHFLRAGGSITRLYIDGYQSGFYDRKRRDVHTPLEIALAVYMGASRGVLERLAGVRWDNYTRGGE